MPVALPPVVRRYFDYEASRDIDSIVALFNEDAVVVDERATWAGAAAIHDWQAGPASKYTYTTEVLGGEAVGSDRFVVAGRLTGNFPGGSADLKWDFTIAGDHIARLVIAPQIARGARVEQRCCGPPKEPRSTIYVAMLFGKYPNEIRVVQPPNGVFKALAFVGRVLGFKLDR